MESIVKKLFLIGSATLAIAVTLTSTSTQAFECTAEEEAAGHCTSDLDNSTNTTFGMDSTFSFSIAANTFALNGVTGDTISLTDFNTKQGNIGVGVVSNQPFQIQLTATNTTGNLDGTQGGHIAPVAGGPLADLPAGQSSWGIWRLDRDNESTKGYLGLSSTATTFYKSGTGANFLPAYNTGKEDTGKFVKVPFGARVNTDTAPDTYSTTVKVTVIDNVN